MDDHVPHLTHIKHFNLSTWTFHHEGVTCLQGRVSVSNQWDSLRLKRPTLPVCFDGALSFKPPAGGWTQVTAEVGLLLSTWATLILHGGLTCYFSKVPWYVQWKTYYSSALHPLPAWLQFTVAVLLDASSFRQLDASGDYGPPQTEGLIFFRSRTDSVQIMNTSQCLNLSTNIRA